MDTALATKPAYAELTRQQLRIYRFRHLDQMIWWDRATMMPPKGNEARAAAQAELGAHIHRLQTEPKQRQLLDAADAEPLDVVEQAEVVSEPEIGGVPVVLGSWLGSWLGLEL